MTTHKAKAKGKPNPGHELLIARARNPRYASRIKHALTGSPTYWSWVQMWQRCGNPNATAYHRYGGRGIKVCAEWNSFLVFLRDMGLRPKGRTLDRINNDGDYEPGNCRWATSFEQGISRMKKFCLRGHRMSETEYRNKRGDRCCRECKKIRFNKWLAKK